MRSCPASKHSRWLIRGCQWAHPLTTSSTSSEAKRWQVLHGVKTEGSHSSNAIGDPRTAQGSRHETNTRHLLRAILRECTYLPDSFARKWLSQHVLGRFRAFTYKAWNHRDDPAFEHRLQSKFKEAAWARNQLHRANAGERKPLLKVLLLVYGRTGRRRHELLQPFMSKAGQAFNQVGAVPAKQGKDDDSTAEPLGANLEVAMAPRRATTPSASTSSAKEVNAGARHPYVPDLTPHMRALLQSQIKNPPPNLTRSTLRRMNTRIDEQNSWFRQMPRVRVKNATKQWYAELLERVHPPLPTAEWVRLRDLATGTLTEPTIPRRASPQSSGQDVSNAVVMYGKPKSLENSYSSITHPHKSRAMRRLWAQVFAQCPRLDWEQDSKTWRVSWGEHAMYGYGYSQQDHATSDAIEALQQDIL